MTNIYCKTVMLCESTSIVRIRCTIMLGIIHEYIEKSMYKFIVIRIRI